MLQSRERNHQSCHIVIQQYSPRRNSVSIIIFVSGSQYCRSRCVQGAGAVRKHLVRDEPSNICQGSVTRIPWTLYMRLQHHNRLELNPPGNPRLAIPWQGVQERKDAQAPKEITAEYTWFLLTQTAVCCCCSLITDTSPHPSVLLFHQTLQEPWSIFFPSTNLQFLALHEYMNISAFRPN